MTTILITGATRGLGLAAARDAADRGAHVLVAGRSVPAVRAAAREVRGHPVVVDLENLADVARCVDELPALDAVALNAGLQIVTGATRTTDDFETTFQINHLAQLLLIDRLLARPAPPGRVVFTGSATHDPERRSGMPAPLDGDIAAWARAGDGNDVPGTAGRRRYTTSKLLNAATAAGLARERPDVHVTCFDPGLMLDTGLSRQYPPLARRLSTLLSPVIARAVPVVSTSKRSGAALARLLLQEPPPAGSGGHVDHHLRTVPASAQARDRDFQDRVLRDSRRLLGTWDSPHR